MKKIFFSLLFLCAPVFAQLANSPGDKPHNGQLSFINKPNVFFGTQYFSTIAAPPYDNTAEVASPLNIIGTSAIVNGSNSPGIVGGAINITAGKTYGSSSNGGAITITGGDGNNGNNGGAISINGGPNGTTGGAISMTSGVGFGSGTVTIKSGNGPSGGGGSGTVTLTSGDSIHSTPGNLNLNTGTAGVGSSHAPGGTINIVPGASNNQNGAPVNITGGTTNTSGDNGGNVVLAGGPSGGGIGLPGNVQLKTPLSDTNNNIMISQTAPTVSSGCGTSPTVTGANTAGFQVTIGTSPGSTCNMTMPTATTGWACSANDITTATEVVKQTGSTTTSASFTGYLITSGLATAFTAADKIVFNCMAF